MTISAAGRLRYILLVILLAGLILFAFSAGKILTVDAPQASDLIVVLAGETDRRPVLALDLLHRGYAPRMLLNVPANAKVYDTTLLQLADLYLRGVPDAANITICPIRGLSTRDEARDVGACLARENASRILIVTSNYHTRRALSIFQHEITGKSFSVAGARDDSQFGIRWWTNRQWAKTCLDEWLRLLWWEAVERWR